jgi:hypothetical protein
MMPRSSRHFLNRLDGGHDRGMDPGSAAPPGKAMRVDVTHTRPLKSHAESPARRIRRVKAAPDLIRGAAERCPGQRPGQP